MNQTTLSCRVDQRVAMFLATTIGIRDEWTYSREGDFEKIVYTVNWDRRQVGQLSFPRTTDTMHLDAVGDDPQFKEIAFRFLAELKFWYEAIWITGLSKELK